MPREKPRFKLHPSWPELGVAPMAAIKGKCSIRPLKSAQVFASVGKLVSRDPFIQAVVRCHGAPEDGMFKEAIGSHEATSQPGRVFVVLETARNGLERLCEKCPRNPANPIVNEQ